jgi:hypothetical protein
MASAVPLAYLWDDGARFRISDSVLRHIGLAREETGRWKAHKV